MNTDPTRDDALTLEILGAIERDEHVSQRHLARSMGVALGLANSYLKRSVRKGFVKISEAPANRYLYYLTPKGFAEKSRLTAQYLSYSLAFYRQAGESCLRLFNQCEAQGWVNLLLCGASDLAEIATLRAMERNVAIIGIFDPNSDRKQFLKCPVWRTIEDAAPHDACILTDLVSSQASYQLLKQHYAQDRILVPDVLRLDSRSGEVHPQTSG